MEHHHPTGEVRRGMSEKLRILIVDDDTTFLEDISFMLRDRYELGFAKSGAEALAAFRSVSWDAVLLDIDLGRGIDGFGVLDAMHAEEPDLPVFMVTRDTSSASAATAFKKGAVDYIDKRPDLADLERKITRALRERILERIARELSAGAGRAQGGMIGKSGPMVALRRAIVAAARSKGPVFVTGETGTGKELVAREFHRLAAPGKPFVAVNCAAFTKELIGSELFGHEKGAFTGAAERHVGKFELVADGVLFLDEITEIDSGSQAKLLRAVDQMEFERIGGGRSIRFRGRLIASSNRSVPEALKKGVLREDLYYRLNAFPVAVPPLRDRMEDIPLLARYFARRTARDLGMPTPELSAEMLRTLCGHDWPGNVRELERVVERLVGQGELIMPDELSAERPDASSTQDLLRLPYLEARETVMREFKQRYVRPVLASCGGNVAEAAARMGLSEWGLRKILLEIENSKQRQLRPSDTPGDAKDRLS
ncbi:MAG: sigma-54-dependent Fis family transcriptional regulator [Candidatus Latescibacterota bacterium]|nr:MAG: sigma-54-dependent Fis family transcriptional regulator [Candidatus Latescibacterota bacterium]